ncbi:hypothetical protein MRS76_02860 [Rhizobiaceae bacterium n13]|uniref:Kazal-like domain-containing protein n=1 Tax=Ferirhizobium litorale TaxID=2927786 RepID=A0AAE3QD52_9HYPH|nr:Kazal-type serine protease inhibitor domain-containing protein [Fererhizobium litorale]MDI7860886.1 hypothetical protein [Fererhizobium litorale]MDI7921034.1 hypothetical protein [Fererhizobium litorale]
MLGKMVRNALKALLPMHERERALSAPRGRWLTWQRFAPVLLLPVLSACTVDVAPAPTYPGPRPPGPPICTMEYAPVCGQRGGYVRTFSNACQARADGFQIIDRGECRREPVRPSPPPPVRPPQACTMEYDPVCGQLGSQMRTFGNACQARADGYRVVGRGECRREPVRPSPPAERPPQACSREYAPVCGQRGNRTRTFGNACEARADGYRVIGRGECR